MSNLTPEERQQGRMAILRDVKENLSMYNATTGQYVSLEFSKQIMAPESLQKLIQNKEVKHCNVCAMGAMFMGYVNKFNNYNVQPGIYLSGIVDTQIGETLIEYFTFNELKEIEAAFEGYPTYGDYVYTYAYQFPDDDKRLEAIIDNCIRNDGVFVPEQDITIDLQYAENDEDYIRDDCDVDDDYDDEYDDYDDDYDGEDDDL